MADEKEQCEVRSPQGAEDIWQMSADRHKFEFTKDRCSGCCTGNGDKLSNSQVCCLAQLCLAAALFLSASCATSTPSTLYKG